MSSTAAHVLVRVGKFFRRGQGAPGVLGAVVNVLVPAALQRDTWSARHSSSHTGTRPQ